MRSLSTATLVIARGELDLANVGTLRTPLVRAIGTGGPIILDFTDVTFADSTTIGTVVGAYKRASATGTPMRLVLPPDSRVRQVFDLTGVTLAIPVCDTVDVAVRDVVPGPRRPSVT